MSKKHQKPAPADSQRDTGTADAQTGQPREAKPGRIALGIQLATGEGDSIFANAAVVEKSKCGVTLRFGYVDPRTGRCATVVHIYLPVLSVVDLLTTNSLGISRAVMEKWAALPSDVPDASNALLNYPGQVVPLIANAMIAGVAPFGARMTFQWIDPHVMATDGTHCVAERLLSVRMPSELCGRVWIELANMSQSVLADPHFAHMRSVDPRFGAAGGG